MKLKPNIESEYAAYKALNNEDFYSKGVVDYGERWADLMEAKMASGKKLADIADSTGSAADTDIITGFQYGAAVWALFKFWEHGEELRVWHNSQFKGGEKASGVINPAIVTITENL